MVADVLAISRRIHWYELVKPNFRNYKRLARLNHALRKTCGRCDTWTVKGRDVPIDELGHRLVCIVCDHHDGGAGVVVHQERHPGSTAQLAESARDTGQDYPRIKPVGWSPRLLE